MVNNNVLNEMINQMLENHGYIRDEFDIYLLNLVMNDDKINKPKKFNDKVDNKNNEIPLSLNNCQVKDIEIDLDDIFKSIKNDKVDTFDMYLLNLAMNNVNKNPKVDKSDKLVDKIKDFNDKLNDKKVNNLDKLPNISCCIECGYAMPIQDRLYLDKAYYDLCYCQYHKFIVMHLNKCCDFAKQII
jgi:hypothetical protein